MSRAPLLLAGWLLLGAPACADGARDAGPVAPSGDAVAPAAPPPRFWLAGADLASEPGGAPSRIIAGPAPVELLAGGKVRSLPGAAEPFEGYLPAEALTTPTDRRGLMLHARRVVDLRLGAPDGEVVGRLHPGALVSVAPDAAAGTWLVAVPRYTDVNGGPLLAHVERDALGPEPRPIVPPVLPGEVHHDFSLTLWRDDASNAFVNRTLCGDFHVTEDRGRLRVTQYHAGVELTGRLDFSAPWSWGDRGEHGCLGRLVFRKDGALREGSGRDWLDAVALEAVPPGHRRVDLPPEDPFARVLQQRKSVFWLVRTASGLECHEWRATGTSADEPAKASVDGRASPSRIAGALRRQHDPLHASFDLFYEPSPGGPLAGGLSLAGPHWADGGYRCVRAYGVLGVEGDRLHVRNPRMGEGPPSDWQLVAYHPDDVEHWHLTRDACETAKTHAAEVLSRDPSAEDHLGMHFDCFDALHR